MRASVFDDANKDFFLLSVMMPSVMMEYLSSLKSSINHAVGAPPQGADDIDLPVTDIGVCKIRYDISSLYGNCGIASSKCPLAILLRSGHRQYFENEVVIVLLRIKWKLYGKRQSLYQVATFSLLLLFFTLGFVYRWGTDEITDSTVDGDFLVRKTNATQRSFRTIFRVVTWLVRNFDN
jgi:hypothetical protein